MQQSTVFKPFLDNKGTVGKESPLKDLADKVRFNRKRSNRVSSLKRKNYEVLEELRKFTLGKELSEVQLEYLYKLSRNLKLCSAKSLYREHLCNCALEYIGSHTCDHKLCMVCNTLRQKRLRRKYLLFFENNAALHIIRQKKNGKQRAYTKAVAEKMQQKKDFKAKYELVEQRGYDVMHLTLTVPHYKDTGFRGYPLYYEGIAGVFNRLRKEDEWNNWVYGGEYGIETTRSQNGLNIHIHALLLVKRQRQNRNQLHKYIFERWNRLTVNPYCQREVLEDSARLKILKSNALMAKDADFLERLHPKGSTIITLENIYTIEQDKKQRVTEFGSPAMMQAVLEAISYHFQPQCFDKDKGEYDLDLMLELMPVLEGKLLYRKFGCLHKEESLNIKCNVAERMQEDMEESGQEQVVNPQTLLPAFREEYTFFVTDPARIFHITEDNYRPVISRKAVRTYLHDPPDTLSALLQMTQLALAAICKQKKQGEESVLDGKYFIAAMPEPSG